MADAPRVCAREGCSVSMEGRDARARFCSDACRAEDWKGRTGYVDPRTDPNGNLPHRQEDETQEDFTLRCLRLRGEIGVHTFELRQRFIANPSERIRRLEAAGVPIAHGQREQFKGKAYGTRYFLIEDVGAGEVQAA